MAFCCNQAFSLVTLPQNSTQEGSTAVIMRKNKDTQQEWVSAAHTTAAHLCACVKLNSQASHAKFNWCVVLCNVLSYTCRSLQCISVSMSISNIYITKIVTSWKLCTRYGTTITERCTNQHRANINSRKWTIRVKKAHQRKELRHTISWKIYRSEATALAHNILYTSS